MLFLTCTPACVFSARETLAWDVCYFQTTWRMPSERAEKNPTRHQRQPQSPGRDVATVFWTHPSSRCVICNTEETLLVGHTCALNITSLCYRIYKHQKRRAEMSGKWFRHMWPLVTAASSTDDLQNESLYSDIIYIEVLWKEVNIIMHFLTCAYISVLM